MKESEEKELAGRGVNVATSFFSSRSQGSHMDIGAGIWGSMDAPSREDMAADREGNSLSGGYRARVWGTATEVGTFGRGRRGNMVWAIGGGDTRDSKDAEV